MKVSELIEKLKSFDPEMTVLINDSEYGPEHIAVAEENVTYRYPNEARVIMFSEEYAAPQFETQDLDEKYIIKKEWPKLRQYKPNPIMDNLKIVYDSMVSRDTVILKYVTANLPKPVDGYITFPIHNKRETE